MYSRRLPLITVALAATLLAACSSTALKTYNPRIISKNSWQEPVPTSNSIATSLLEEIHDPQLKTLVEETLNANFNLQKLALQLQGQHLRTGQVDAQRLPTANVALGKNRAGKTGGNSSVNSQYKLGVALSWEIDVWGRLADASRAAAASTDAMAADYQAARDSLAARVMKSWIDISFRQQMITTEQDRIRSLRAIEQIITSNYLDGSGNLVDLEAARANTAQAEARLSAMKQAQKGAWRQLALLQGKLKPADNLNPSRDIDIPAPPPWIPSQVIARRPDLQAAYQNILAADASQAVAQKKLLPALQLSSTLSQDRPHLGELLSGNVAWNLLTNLTAPLYNGGRLKAAAEIAGLQTRRRYLEYQETILVALNEVETALGNEATLAEQQAFLKTALKHSENSLNHYRNSYRDGVSGILELLTAQQRVYDARIQLLQTRQNRLANRITLSLALGMGV